MTRLIDADALKEAIAKFHQKENDRLHNPLWGSIGLNALNRLIDYAPTVDAIPNKEGYEMYNKGYMSGYEYCTKDVIHSIAKQYSEHNELVPSWLHKCNMREADND